MVSCIINERMARKLDDKEDQKRVMEACHDDKLGNRPSLSHIFFLLSRRKTFWKGQIVTEDLLPVQLAGHDERRERKNV